MTTTDELREAVKETIQWTYIDADEALNEDVDRILRLVVDACAERAADFVWQRLYRGGGDRALPVMSFHSQEIAARIRALAPKEPHD